MNEHTVYLDTEGTGLDPDEDAMLEIAIVDDAGTILLNSLIAPPPGLSAWPLAQTIHGITPAMVSTAPSLDTLRPQIEAAVRNRDVVIYNAAFDAGFLGTLLDGARSVRCCMEAWSEHVNEWDSRFQRLRWHKLVSAAAAVGFEWPGNAHRALADTLACRAVWQYLHNPTERERVDALIHNHRLEAEATSALRSAEHKTRMRDNRWRDYISEFLLTWWLRRFGAVSHWSRHQSAAQTREDFAILFFGKPLALLALEDSVDRIFTSRKSIPDTLRPANHFPKDSWFQAELNPCAAYIGRKTGWRLYDIAEYARIRALFPLRFQEPVRFPGDALLTRTALLKAGMTVKQVASLVPVTERQNRFSGDWYYLYQVRKNILPAPDTVPLNCCTPDLTVTAPLPLDTILPPLKTQ
ncbi:3'-5' exonuclease [Escherichia coli]|nr:3'-5' exonuclease [Escherichia coli]